MIGLSVRPAAAAKPVISVRPDWAEGGEQTLAARALYNRDGDKSGSPPLKTTDFQLAIGIR